MQPCDEGELLELKIDAKGGIPIVVDVEEADAVSMLPSVCSECDFNLKHVTGSPLEVNVEAPTTVMKPALGNPCNLTLDVILTDAELKEFKVGL